ncbi:hypothetical protein [Motilibacter deserti]|uniref:Uncharacterized protein n=1 Tax=Motilibacter deserti TaxID=2714956 RepID=A0ABX0H0B1_9ACTN|nr:hypothetical protein [Motilibacter deserti]NHC15459.1 hypothetical protein [Motilibacter deserti]
MTPPAAPDQGTDALRAALEAIEAHIAAARTDHELAVADAAAEELAGRCVERRMHQRRADRAELRLSVWLQAYALVAEGVPGRLPLSA